MLTSVITNGYGKYDLCSVDVERSSFQTSWQVGQQAILVRMAVGNVHILRQGETA
jgi:hypothetical protein